MSKGMGIGITESLQMIWKEKDGSNGDGGDPLGHGIHYSKYPPTFKVI